MTRLGLLAGSGKLPLEVVRHCVESDIELFCVLLRPYARAGDYAGLNYVELEIGQVGKIMNFFRKNNATQLVLAGAIEKPSLGLLKMDAEGFSLAKNLLKGKIIGDNSMLEIVISFLEKRGFQILELDCLVGNMKLDAGPNNGIKCKSEHLEDIEIGRSVIEKLSEFDLGQAVVVQRKTVIGVECCEGTAGLIERTGGIRLSDNYGSVLVKIGKIGQTRKADLPSIGPDTMEQLHRGNFAGAAIDCNNCLIISRNRTVEMATKYNLFLYGVNVKTLENTV
ncbi:MAG: UDP-2,3-diacylglucosamine diphosphatase LpxI [Rickettsiales bacterium]|jgi:DUF1009 family protein|nr:UDP-2,3-diacylglucosamine diphosphatase LpxI [Rickettsiales bacterium]